MVTYKNNCKQSCIKMEVNVYKWTNIKTYAHCEDTLNYNIYSHYDKNINPQNKSHFLSVPAIATETLYFIFSLSQHVSDTTSVTLLKCHQNYNRSVVLCTNVVRTI
jgi:hypothetical protein